MIKTLQKRAFTLIELLVVIAIIGILASLIIVSLTGARSKATDTQIKNNLRNVNTALEQYYTDKGGVYYGAATQIDFAATAGFKTALADYIPSTSAAYTYSGVTTGYITDGTPFTKYFAAAGLKSTSESPVASGTGNGIFCTNDAVATSGGACGANGTNAGSVRSGAPNTLILTAINSGTSSFTGKAFGVFGPQ